MKYRDLFEIDFINKINEIVGKKVIDPDEEANDFIDVKSFLERAGYKIDKSRHDNSGFLDSKSKTVYIDSNDSSTRQRFTMAHELGHIVQGKAHAARHHNSSDYTYEEKKDEVFANSFAAQILMPLKLIVKSFDNIINDEKMDRKNLSKNELDKIIVYTAEKLNVSSEALKIRVYNLSLISTKVD